MTTNLSASIAAFVATAAAPVPNVSVQMRSRLSEFRSRTQWVRGSSLQGLLVGSTRRAWVIQTLRALGLRPLVWIALALACVGTDPALAHAFPDRAIPAMGSIVHVAPTQLKMWFTEAIEPAFSSLRVFDANGKEVDRGNVTAGMADRRLLTVSLSLLPPGRYKVVWQVVSVDTHKTHGAFLFTVAP